MNQPDRYARFVLPEGVPQVEVVKDTKLSNAATVTIRLEDHTLGNLLRQQLHRDPQIVFAGYRIPHPLNPLMQVRVRTTANSTPVGALRNAIAELRAEVGELQQQLQTAAPRDELPPPLGGQQQQQGYAPMDGMQQGGYAPAVPPGGGYAPVGGYQPAGGGGGYGGYQ